MPRYQYQSVPPTPPPPTIALGAGNITSAKAGTKSIWLQYRGRGGYSLLSNRVDVTVAAGQRIELTIPSAARPSPNGTYIVEYLILMSESTNPAGACVVASYAGYGSDQTTPSTLPITIYLSRDEHLELYKTVDLESELPTGSDRIHGMRRSVDEDGIGIVAYNASADTWAAPKLPEFNTYITSITGLKGASADLSTIVDTGIITYPSYGMEEDSISVPVGYWLVNDGSQAIAKGTRIGLTVENGSEDVSFTSGIVGGVILTFRGYVNTTTGVLDTTPESGIGAMPTVGVAVPYQGKQTGITLPKDLPVGSACWIDVQASMTPALLNNRITEGSSLRFDIYFYEDYAIWNPTGALLGTFIASDGGRRRLLPDAGLNAIAQSGSGNIVVDATSSFSFQNISAQVVTGFAANTADQDVWIGVNGTCLVSPTQPAGMVKRAEVGTVNGVGKATAWTGSVALDGGKVLTLNVTYPTAVRNDYPDVIKGSAADFNANFVRIYVRPVGGGTILQFQEVVLPGVASQTFTVGGVAGTDIGTTLPTRANNAFGLFEFNTINSVGTLTGDSSFPTIAAAEVAIAFYYSNTITSINHNANGCIAEVAFPLTKVFDRILGYAETFEYLFELRAVPIADISPWQLRTHEMTGDRYRFNPFTQVGEKPDELSPTDLGRWELDTPNVLTQILVFS